MRPALHAQELPLSLTQYAHTAWRVQDGSFIGLPRSLAQTSDGYLWVGTSKGLQRYDGERFEDVHMQPSIVNLPPSITSLAPASDGSLWITTNTALAHLDKGVVTYLPTGLIHANGIIEDHRRQIWMVRSRDPKGPLCQVYGTTLKCHGKSDGIACPYSNTLAESQSGTLWLGSNPLCAWKDGHAEVFVPSGSTDPAANESINALAPRPDDSVFVGFSEPGPHLGLQLLTSGKYSPVVYPGFDGRTMSIESLKLDRTGGLWVGTETQGLFHLHDGISDHFGAADGLSGDRVTDILEDKEGNLWVATRNGVDQFHQLSVVSFGSRQGLSSNSMHSVWATPDNKLFAGSSDGMQILGNGIVTGLKQKDGLPHPTVESIYQEADGDLWVSSGDQLLRYSHGKPTTVTRAGGKPIGLVLKMIGDSQGRIWLVLGSGTDRFVRVEKDLSVTSVAPPDPDVFYADVDPSGTPWFGTEDGKVFRASNGTFTTVGSPNLHYHYRSLRVDSPHSFWYPSNFGLYRWREGRPAAIMNQRNGLPCGDVYDAITDSQGALWLNQPCGFFRIDATQVKHWEDHPESVLTGRLLGVTDGAQNGGTNFWPEMVRSADGKLWLANSSSLEMIDPLHLPFNNQPPPVHIQQIVADHVVHSVAEPLVFPALTRDISIEYAALSFRVPKAMRFRYKLSGVDKDWQDVEGRRQAFYMNLRPGRYRFRVIACNNDGVWNTTGDELTFTIEPALYQTAWFRTLIGLFLVLIAWTVFRLRLRAATQQVESRLGERLMERDRIARELHDTLLQGFQALLLQLQTSIRRIPEQVPERVPALLVLDRGDEILLEGRERVRDLRSHDTECGPLVEMLEKVVSQLQSIEGPQLHLVVEGERQLVRLLVAEEVSLIAREALSNAVRHSRAPQIRCELYFDPRGLRLVVQDNGVGIPQERLQQNGNDGHWGLQGMRERAKKIDGQMILETGTFGTRLDLRVPGRVSYQQTKRVFVQRIKSFRLL